MAENALRCPMMDGTYLEVVGCLEGSLVHLLGGVMDFKILDGFGMILDTGLTLVLVNVNGLEGGRGVERTDGFKKVFPSDVNN